MRKREIEKKNTYLASLRVSCIADSIKLPEAACSFGIGTAIKIPVPSLSLMFASEINNSNKDKNHKLHQFLKTINV